jgi:hypothetical protein
MVASGEPDSALDPAKSRFVFAYGTQSRGGEEETAVFSSNHEMLVKEFQRLFKVLKDELFSREISIHDPEFRTSRKHECDVLATFTEFPLPEIRERIRQCRREINVCATAWPTFEALKTELKHALDNGCTVHYGFWRADDLFIGLRNPADVRGSIRSNETTAEYFADRDEFHTHRCQGQGSVTIFWIDDVIFFAPYWVGEHASAGPHFMVNASSKTGEHLREQFAAMVPAARKGTKR